MLREYRSKSQGTPDLLNYCMMVDDGIMLLKDGAFCAGWSYRGPDHNSADNHDLALLSLRVNNVLCQLGNGWMIHTDMFRRESKGYSRREDCYFPDPVSQILDEERRLQYEAEGVHFESEHTIILTYLPPTEIESRLSKYFINGRDTNNKNWSNELIKFKEKIATLENILNKLLLLKPLDSDSLLTTLHECITGLPYSLKMPKIPVYLDTLLGTQEFFGGLEPKIGNKNLRMIALEELPYSAHPQLLQILDQLPISFRLSNRFIFLDPQTAVSELKKYRRNWFQKRQGLMGLIKEAMKGEENTSVENLDALDMAADVDQALKEAESGAVRYGYFNGTIVLYEENKEILDDSIKTIFEELCNRGFILRNETINAVEAFIGSLPGHGYQNVRRPLINSLNLADIIPLTSVWPGLKYNPCKYFPENSPPLFYAATEGSTPFRTNLHVGDVAHTAIFGATGAGKSTLLGLICSQFFRYKNAQVFHFDVGYSGYVLCKAMKGTHYDILSPNASPSFYPLAHIDEPDELTWACEWIEECLTANNFTVTSSHRNSIRKGLIRLSRSASRTLTELQSAIQDKDIQEALEFYTLSGEMGSVLDSDSDDLQEGRFQVFEMEHLIQKGDARVKPTILYILHQITKRLTKGHPTLIVIEEGKNFLTGKFGEQLSKYLLEIRKKNAGVVFLAQDPSHVLKTEHKENLFNSCLTQIFLPNSKADNEMNYQNYSSIGLSDKQIQIIKTGIPKKHYYVTSRIGNRLIDLGLGKVALSFVGVDGIQDRTRVDELIKQHGNNWIYYWLKERGLPEWASYWEKLSSEFYNFTKDSSEICV